MHMPVQISPASCLFHGICFQCTCPYCVYHNPGFIAGPNGHEYQAGENFVIQDPELAALHAGCTSSVSAAELGDDVYQHNNAIPLEHIWPISPAHFQLRAVQQSPDSCKQRRQHSTVPAEDSLESAFVQVLTSIDSNTVAGVSITQTYAVLLIRSHSLLPFHERPI